MSWLVPLVVSLAKTTPTRGAESVSAHECQTWGVVSDLAPGVCDLTQ